MSAHGPSDAFILVGGRDLSGEIFKMTETLTGGMEQTNGFGDNMEEHTPNGLGVAALAVDDSFYDDKAVGAFDAYKDTTYQVVDYGVAGRLIGAMASTHEGLFVAAFNRISSRAGLTKMGGEFRLRGANQRSQIVHGFVTETTDPFNTRSTPVDQAVNPINPAIAITSSSVANPTVITTPLPHNLITGDTILITGHVGSTPSLNGTNYTATVTGANTFTIPVNVTAGGTGGTFVKTTSTGAVLTMQVLDLNLDGHTNFIGTVVHSADNSTYVTLQAFDAVTTANVVQRKVVTGQVRRYVALDGDFSGAGSAGRRVLPYVAVAR